MIPMTPSTIAHAQEKWGARMWYNAMVPMGTTRFPNRQMKYGVISTKDLIEVNEHHGFMLLICLVYGWYDYFINCNLMKLPFFVVEIIGLSKVVKFVCFW